MDAETESLIRSLSDSELSDLRQQVQSRVDDARHSYKSFREATQESADEFFAVIDDELEKRKAQ